MRGFAFKVNVAQWVDSIEHTHLHHVDVQKDERADAVAGSRMLIMAGARMTRCHAATGNCDACSLRRSVMVWSRGTRSTALCNACAYAKLDEEQCRAFEALLFLLVGR